MQTQVKPGDAVRIAGRTFTIERVFSADYYGNPKYPSPDDGWFIEFTDTNSMYHYWKQYLDGGELLTAREI